MSFTRGDFFLFFPVLGLRDLQTRDISRASRAYGTSGVFGVSKDYEASVSKTYETSGASKASRTSRASCRLSTG